MLRIGIVGCGRILAAHLRGYQLLREQGVDDFQITALCSRQAERAAMYVRRGSGPPQRPPVGTKPGDPLAVGDIYLSDFQPDVPVTSYTDYREMIATGPIDAVNDLTTHALHHQVGGVAIDHGKHLLTEKPLAITVAAAKQMCARAEAAGVILGVLENARNRPDTRHLESLFRGNRQGGELQLILMTNIGNWWAPDQIVAGTPWRHARAQGGGITLDIGVHLFNHLRYVAGEIETVSAHTEVLEKTRVRRSADGSVQESVQCDADDTLLATFRTERGATCNLVASWGGHGMPLSSGGGRGIVYYGSECSVVDGTIERDDGSKQSLAAWYANEVDPAEQRRYFPYGIADQFALNQLDWLTAVRENREPETSGRDGLRDLAVAYAALESSQLGRPVTVEEVLRGEIRAYQRSADSEFGFLDDCEDRPGTAVRKQY